MGGFEPVAKPWAMDGIPENFEFGMLPDDWDQFQILMENCPDPASVSGDGRDQDFHERPGELYPRQQFHHGRGAGM
jgi:4-methylaminobutanoate oxidase (formaldehyde-forming)